MNIWEQKINQLETLIQEKLDNPPKNYDLKSDLPTIVKNLTSVQTNKMLDMLRVNPALGNLPENTRRINTVYDIIEHNAFETLVEHGMEFISKNS